MAAEDHTYLDDAASLRAIIETMPSAERKVYETYGALSLESSFPGRRMVLYSLKDHAPNEIALLSFGDLELVWPGPPKITISDNDGDMIVDVCPQRWRSRDIFFHVPQKFELRYKGKKTKSEEVQFVPHYAVLIKTKSKEHLQVEGHTYCVTLNKFRERFPQTPLRY